MKTFKDLEFKPHPSIGSGFNTRAYAITELHKAESALDVAVEGLGFFATEGFYRMTDFITTSPVTEVGKMPENIKVYGNPVSTLGLKKATEALDKIKQIREKK